MAFDSHGRLFVCDRDNYGIRVCDRPNAANARFRTFCDRLDFPSEGSRFQPTYIAIDSEDMLYVTTGSAGHCVWQIKDDSRLDRAINESSTRSSSTSSHHASFDDDGIHSAAGAARTSLSSLMDSMPWDIELRGRLRARRLAGSPSGDYGSRDDVGVRALFSRPFDIVVDNKRRALYLTDYLAGSVRAIQLPDCAVTTLASKLPFASGLCLSTDNRLLFVVQTQAASVKMLDLCNVFDGASPSQLLSNIQLSPPPPPPPSSSSSNLLSWIFGSNNAPATTVPSPQQPVPPITVSPHITVAPMATRTVARRPSPTAHELKSPNGIVCDASKRLYICDTGNRCLRVLDVSPLLDLGMPSHSLQLQTLCGRVSQSGLENGSADRALFDDPRSICMDTFGNLYVTERSRIRMIVNSGALPPRGQAWRDAKRLLPLVRLLLYKRSLDDNKRTLMFLTLRTIALPTGCSLAQLDKIVEFGKVKTFIAKGSTNVNSTTTTGSTAAPTLSTAYSNRRRFESIISGQNSEQ
jgi:sugar lactone lactonase YvrE